MTEFDERERAFEKKFEIDEELHFKIAARAVRLFGQWAAAQLGMKGKDAASYAGIYIDLGMAKTGIEDAVAKAEKDLRAKGLDLSRHHLEHEFETFYQEARRELLGA